MLKALMEFRRGILFVRLYGKFDDDAIKIFDNEVKEVIIKTGIKYVVLNVNNLEDISQNGIKEIRKLRRIINKTDGQFFLFGGEIKELKSLVNLENELNVFERVVI